MPFRRRRLTDEAPAPVREGLERLRRELGVPDSFPAEVLAAADSAVAAPRLPTLDRTDLEFVTIDPPGAKDLDQALFIERASGASGFLVWYAIADVGAFVTAGDPIDRETHARGQTFYAPHRRTPLHPPAISEDAASLLAGQVRPALLWRLPVDEDGAFSGPHVERALVRSREQLTYEQAQARIDDGTASESLQLLRTVGLLREQVERDRGGVSLNIPEQEVKVVGRHWELEFRSTLPVEGWNAQISLMTGMAAAQLMISGEVGILRTLPPAEEASLQRLRNVARALRIPWPADMAYPEFVRSLDSTRGDHAAMLYACTALFRGAGYQPLNGTLPAELRHAALASEYAHTTAPLRRLVDRFVLETCAALCAGVGVPDWVRAELDELPRTMAESDRRAKKYERGIVDLTEALVLSGREGDVFTGTVVDVDTKRDRGRFMISEPAVEADVTGGQLPLGQDIQARLTAVDLTTGTTQFTDVTPRGTH